jgi:hypothetical protein
MAIEGPLRELGIHDVFQLLDLSRKTGTLRVRSQMRQDEGVVYFNGGRVVHANIRSKPGVLPSDELSQRELERQVRAQIEATIFELLSWQEGFFSFEETSTDDFPPGPLVAVATESLLMEGARRIDEWSRIAQTIPDTDVIPGFAPIADGHETRLDLLPREWEVLTRIDGAMDIRTIAAGLGREEFEIAKIVYGLVTTGVLEIRGRSASAVANV